MDHFLDERFDEVEEFLLGIVVVLDVVDAKRVLIRLLHLEHPLLRV